MTTIKLDVWRDLKNRLEGEPDDGPLAREAHQLRAAALHEDLREFEVVSWGDTDDVEPHELVSLTIAILAAPAVKAAIVPAAAFVGGVLSDVVTSTVADGVKYLLSKFARRVRPSAGKTTGLKPFQNFGIQIPKSASVAVDLDGVVLVTLASGKSVSISYDASDEEARAATDRFRIEQT